MGTYDARRDFGTAPTARDYGELLQQVRRPPSAGVLWLVLAPRRYGKTWTLKALESRLGDSACYLDLRLALDREDWRAGARIEQGGHWLLDEISGLVGKGTAPQDLASSQDFLTRCEKLKRAKTSIVLALTPREIEHLRHADKDGDYLSPKSILTLSPLSPKEVGEVARTTEARALLTTVPPSWRRTPFLLELLFEVDEKARAEGEPLGKYLIPQALDVSEGGSPHRYFHDVFWDALTEEHREVLRSIARSEPVDAHVCQPLRQAGLVEKDPTHGRLRLTDPVLAERLSLVRIHHISDVHFGPNTAQGFDDKEGGPLAKATNPGSVRDGYLSHVEGLHATDKAPHLLIVSGDLTERATSAQFEEARLWLEQIEKILAPHPLLGDSTRRVLLVGGNHDVDWSQAKPNGDERARHETFAKVFKDYVHPHLETPPETRDFKPVKWKEFGLTILLMGTSELGGQVQEEVEQRARVYELSKLSAAASPEERDKAETAAIQAARIDPGLVHHRVLKCVSTHKWEDSLSVRIAVLHHPLSPLPSTEVTRYAGLLNAGAVKQVLLEKGFCLALCGHVHAGWFAEERWHERTVRTLRIAAAPSLGSSSIAENNGFNVVEILRELNREGRATYQLQVRRFVRKGERSWEQHSDQMGPFSPGS
ncbi:metallophosphoesterase family protein [Hyalangium versicolor]|uniref:metallophosphoesterase family protein n=1 Tax=Hyalangium versicolor TaxID=2861190 RepID=UPI001CCA111D|nr:metallophosphoesterase [Hyalangium versicolor]